MRKPSSVEMIELEVHLLDAPVPIWRTILVPSRYSLHELHQILQITMGWFNSHLYEFKVGDKGYSDSKFGVENTLSGKTLTLADALKVSPEGFSYWYDFGDDWKHSIRSKRIHLVDEEMPPEVLAGEGACPPENIGGVMGYEQLLKALKNPKAKANEDIIQWLNGPFDPSSFNARHVSAALATWWQLDQE